MLQCPIVLPTSEFFNRGYRGTDEDATVLFRRVCTLVGVDPDTVEFFVGEGRIERQTDGLIAAAGGSAGGTYHPNPGGKPYVGVTEDLLPYPCDVVAVLAHELCHVRLLEEGRLTGNEEDHEPLTDLVTACLGFGVFSANASVAEHTERVGFGRWWSAGSGYLSVATWSYALAALAVRRGDPTAPWSRHLCPSARQSFRRSMKFLLQARQEYTRPNLPSP